VNDWLKNDPKQISGGKLVLTWVGFPTLPWIWLHWGKRHPDYC